MKALIKKIVATFGATLLIAVPQVAIAGAAHAQTDIQEGVCQGVTLDQNATSATCTSEDSQSNFNDLMTRVINIFSIVVGSISVIMIIIGGFRYIISAGDSNNVTGAKNTILYAIVGLVIVLFSQIIVRFVLKATTS